MDINLVYLFICSPILGLLVYALYKVRKDIAAFLKDVFQTKYAADFGMLLGTIGFIVSGLDYLTKGFQNNDPTCFLAGLCTTTTFSFDPLPSEILFAVSLWVIVILAVYKYETGKKNNTPGDNGKRSYE